MKRHLRETHPKPLLPSIPRSVDQEAGEEAPALDLLSLKHGRYRPPPLPPPLLTTTILPPLYAGGKLPSMT